MGWLSRQVRAWRREEREEGKRERERAGEREKEREGKRQRERGERNKKRKRLAGCWVWPLKRLKVWGLYKGRRYKGRRAAAASTRAGGLRRPLKGGV